MRKRFALKIGSRWESSPPLHFFSSLCLPLRCDGGRLQRDQGGGQVYQKRRHSAGVHRGGLGHDVRTPADAPVALRAT